MIFYNLFGFSLLCYLLEMRKVEVRTLALVHVIHKTSEGSLLVDLEIRKVKNRLLTLRKC